MDGDRREPGATRTGTPTAEPPTDTPNGTSRPAGERATGSDDARRETNGHGAGDADGPDGAPDAAAAPDADGDAPPADAPPADATASTASTADDDADVRSDAADAETDDAADEGGSDDGTPGDGTAPDTGSGVAAATTAIDAPTTATRSTDAPAAGSAGRAAGARGIDGPTMQVDRQTAERQAAVRTGAPRARRPATPHRAPARPRSAAPASGPMPRVGGGEPMPGAMIVDRYRLVAEVGQDRPAGAVLWQARDVTLERDVAITLLVGGWQADARASSTLARATRNAQFEHPHAARMLDVVRPGGARLPQGVLGAAVAEWTPGRDLARLVADGPLRPSAALRVVEQLASAVAEAHRSGLVLGMEHPQRVRVNARASARLAFPLPRGEATVADDVQGLGALMYLLLTARWPATNPDAPAPAGLKLAPRRAGGGGPVPARQARPDLPVELGALVDRTLDGAGGIRTAAAVHRLVSQMREGLEDGGVLLPVLEDGQAIEGEPGEVWHTEDEPEEKPDPERQRKLRIGVSLLVLATLAIVAFLALQLVSLFGGGGSSAPPLVIPSEAPPAAGAPPAPAAAAAPPPAQPAAGTPVALSSVAVYAPSGDPDNPSQVNRAVDNDPATAWSTSEYRQQFPALKPGVGMMTTFAAPSTVSAVTVRSPSPGTRIEIRSAAASDVPLGRTQLVGSGTVANAGGEGGAPPELRIPVSGAPQTSHLLVWVTELGEDDDRYVSELSEVAILRGG